jgi:hypothetical protein
VDARQALLLRQLLSGSPGLDRASDLARALTSGRHTAGGLLLVGTPDDEPWHFGAHLDDEARWAGVPELAPTWVRWNPPPGAPPHLAVGMDRLAAAGRGETLLVATPTGAVDPLLERVSDARRHGALILAVEGAPTELQSLAHEAVTAGGDGAPIGYDLTTHLVSVAAGESANGRTRTVRTRLRDRIGRMLDRVSGPEPG